MTGWRILGCASRFRKVGLPCDPFALSGLSACRATAPHRGASRYRPSAGVSETFRKDYDMYRSMRGVAAKRVSGDQRRGPPRLPGNEGPGGLGVYPNEHITASLLVAIIGVIGYVAGSRRAVRPGERKSRPICIPVRDITAPMSVSGPRCRRSSSWWSGTLPRRPTSIPPFARVSR